MDAHEVSLSNFLQSRWILTHAPIVSWYVSCWVARNTQYQCLWFFARFLISFALCQPMEAVISPHDSISLPIASFIDFNRLYVILGGRGLQAQSPSPLPESVNVMNVLTLHCSLLIRHNKILCLYGVRCAVCGHFSTGNIFSSREQVEFWYLYAFCAQTSIDFLAFQFWWRRYTPALGIIK